MDFFTSIGLLPMERIFFYCKYDAITCIDVSRLNKAWHARLAPWLRDTAPRALRVECAKLSALRTIYDAHYNRFQCFERACGAGRLSTAQWLFAKFGHALFEEENAIHDCAWRCIVRSCLNGHLHIIQWLHALWNGDRIYDPLAHRTVASDKWATLSVMHVCLYERMLGSLTLRDLIFLQATHESTVGAWLDASSKPKLDYGLLHRCRTNVPLNFASSLSYCSVVVAHNASIGFEYFLQMAILQAEQLALPQDAMAAKSKLVENIADALQRSSKFPLCDKITFWHTAFRKSCKHGKLVAANFFLQRYVLAGASAQQRKQCIFDQVVCAWRNNDQRVIKWLLRAFGDDKPPMDWKLFANSALCLCNTAVLDLIADAWSIAPGSLSQINSLEWSRCVQSVVRNACRASSWTDADADIQRACAPIVWLERAFARRLCAADAWKCFQTTCAMHCPTVASWIYNFVARNDGTLADDAAKQTSIDKKRSLWKAAVLGCLQSTDARACYLTLQWLDCVFPCPFDFFHLRNTLKHDDKNYGNLFAVLQWLRVQRGMTRNDVEQNGLLARACSLYSHDNLWLKWMHESYSLTFADVQMHSNGRIDQLPPRCVAWLQNALHMPT